MGTFAGGGTLNITNLVGWGSSTPSVATVSHGLAAGSLVRQCRRSPMPAEYMDCPCSRQYLPAVAHTTRNQKLLACFDRNARSINQQRIAALHHEHVFIEFMYVLGRSCGLGACPKCHLAHIGSVEDVSFDTGSCLIRPGDTVRAVLHKLRECVHVGEFYTNAEVAGAKCASSENPETGGSRLSETAINCNASVLDFAQNHSCPAATSSTWNEG